jgi:molecular chaperone HtpG
MAHQHLGEAVVSYKFQINLRGIIDLLSNHLYSGPEVFLRELLQNGVDAIRARVHHEPDFVGSIGIEVVAPRDGRAPTLVFTDDGVGLTEDEVHRFLATIGQSSKGAEFWERPGDFLGQFGIGLLSCFLVSNEIVVLSRSARGESTGVEWRGRPDGTYTLKTLESEVPVGTQVYLTCKEGCEEFFDSDKVVELATHYGGLLPYPIRVRVGRGSRVINADPPPWRRKFPRPEAQRKALVDYGQKVFDEEFFDAIPLRCPEGDIEGAAFVLSYAPSLASRRTHRVYLKHMLLSENAENLVPDWAFFVKCLVNANDLRPTASRESFYEDERLVATRAALGRSLRAYLINLAEREPDRLRRFIALHQLSIKALAVQDDEFYRLFIDWLPFETSLGTMSFGEYRQEHSPIRYIPSVDQFRQIVHVAAAQGLAVINAGYVYDAELMAKFSDVFPDQPIETIDPAALTQSFDDLTVEEREQYFAFINAADVVLQPFKCSAEVKKFQPAEVPALYSTDRDAEFLRSVEQTREVADSLWSGVLGNIAGRGKAGPYAQLCFNFHNTLVQRLARLTDRTLRKRAIEMLYVQSLLLGHHPLSSRELALLGDGLLGLIELSLETREEGK